MDVAKVVSMVSGKIEDSGYRVAKNMWFTRGWEGHDEIQDNINPLLEAVTGLNIDHSETLQMNNYGLGGML